MANTIPSKLLQWRYAILLLLPLLLLAAPLVLGLSRPSATGDSYEQEWGYRCCTMGERCVDGLVTCSRYVWPAWALTELSKCWVLRRGWRASGSRAPAGASTAGSSCCVPMYVESPEIGSTSCFLYYCSSWLFLCKVSICYWVV